MKKLVPQAIGILLIAIGLVTLPLPIPFPGLLIVIGLAILMMYNRPFAAWARRRRYLNPRLDSMTLAVRGWVPVKLRQALDRSGPHRKRRPPP